MLTVEIVSTSELQELRQLVLWPHLTVEECIIEPDEIDSTYQIVVKDEGNVVCCGTFLVETKAQFNFANQYRLRAMGTHPDYRKKGLGKLLIDFAKEQLKQNGVELIWCDARIVATGFYQKQGFKIIGEQYEVPVIGPHYLMYIEL